MLHDAASPSTNVRHHGRRIALVVALALSATRALGAQTDFYNTSVGRPLRMEDAVPVEYRAIELNVAPVRIDFMSQNTRFWSLHPEATIGILPRTQLQLAVPLAYVDASGTSARGVAGIDVSVLHALNMETSIPALAIAGDVSLPVGPLGGTSTYGTVKALVTRTLPWARFHANAQFTAGPSASSVDPTTSAANDGRDLSRWLAGIAVDRTFVFQSLLVTAESFAEQSIDNEASVAWSAGTGLRYQLDPRWTMDAGIGRRFSGDNRAWYVTIGSAYSLGLR
ncbi:MAG TPA: transporter [Gemmatimonadaceae bacterium]|nr:transporter [Gemmatimonadaceae bacterium]